jgi:hypothetical protein
MVLISEVGGRVSGNGTGCARCICWRVNEGLQNHALTAILMAHCCIAASSCGMSRRECRRSKGETKSSQAELGTGWRCLSCPEVLFCGLEGRMTLPRDGCPKQLCLPAARPSRLPTPPFFACRQGRVLSLALQQRQQAGKGLSQQQKQSRA